MMSPEDSLQQAKQLFAKQNYREALSLCQNLAKDHPTFHPVYHLVGQISEQANNDEQALIAYRAAIKIDSRIPEYHLLAGKLLEKSSQSLEAIMHLKIAIFLDENFVEAHLILIRIYLKQKEFEKALKQLTLVHEVEPQNTEIAALSGQAHQGFGQTEEALRFLEPLLTSSPSPEIFYYAGLAYLGAAKYDQSVTCFQHYLNTNPQDTVASVFLKIALNPKQLPTINSQNISSIQPEYLIHKILNTEVISIFAWGSSGSNFFQSLLDFHPQILMFPGANFFHYHTNYWDEYMEVKQENPFLNIYHMLDSFIFNHIFLFDGKALATDKKYDSLGPDGNTSLFADQNIFKKHVLTLYGIFQKQKYPLSRKLFLSLLYYAYALTLERDIGSIKYIVHPIHSPNHYDDIKNCKSDFPNMRSIVTYRHPLKSLHSNLRIRTKISEDIESIEDTVYNGTFNKFYKFQLCGYLNAHNQFDLPVYYLNIEDLHQTPKKYLQDICNWLDIQWHDNLMKSTFNDLQYWGSSHDRKKLSGFSPTYHQHEKWKPYFNENDSRVMFALCNQTYPDLNFEKPKAKGKDILPLFIFLPAKLETLAFLKALKANEYSKLRQAFKHYLERILATYKFWLNERIDY